MASTAKSRTMKIPESEWYRHKEKILEMFLHSDSKLKEIAVYMKENHNFTATIAQYEAQLRSWDARRRLTLQEWHAIFKQLDNLQPDTKSRIMLSGRPLPEQHIRRARKHWKRKSVPEGLVDNSSSCERADAYIEIQTGENSWRRLSDTTRIAPNLPQNSLQFPSAMELDASQPQERLTVVDSSHTVQRVQQNSRARDGSLDLGSITPAAWNVYVPGGPKNIDFASYLEQASQGPLYWDWNSSGSGLTHQMLRLPAATNGSLSEHLSSEMTSFSVVPFKWLESLSYAAFENILTSRRLLYGVHDMMQNSQFPYGDGDDTSRQSLNVIGTFETLALDIGESQQPSYRFGNVLNAFLTLLPGKGHETSYDDINGLVSNGNMLHAVLNRLLFSMANGLAGLEDASMKGIFKYLWRSRGILGQVIQCLKTAGGYTAQAIAESLFKISFKANENEVLRQLLVSGLIDVYESRFIGPGLKKMTPIEALARKGNWDILELLLSTDEDQIQKLICALRYAPIQLPATLRPDSSDSPREGRISQLSPSPVWSAILQRYQVPIFTCSKDASWTPEEIRQLCLSEMAHYTKHSSFIESKVLGELPEALGDADATDVMRSIIQACEMACYGQCLKNRTEAISSIAVCSVKEGCFNFSTLLIPYCSDNCVKAILNKAIMKHQDDLAVRALEQIEDCDVLSTRGWIEEDERVPLATAIIYENRPVLDRLETAGALDNLDSCDYFAFKDTLHAATQVQDVEYIRKLLRLYPGAPFYAMGPAIQCAILKYHDEITLELASAMDNNDLADLMKRLLVTAVQSGKFDTLSASGDLLLFAVEVGDIGYVRKYLDFMGNPLDRESVTKALWHAITHSQDEIAAELVNSGISLWYIQKKQSLLTNALRMKMPQLVRAIFNADVGRYDISPIDFAHALVWGDKSIIDDLTFVCGRAGLPEEFDFDEQYLKDDIVRMFALIDADVLEHFLSQWRMSTDQISTWLALTTRERNVAKLRLFLDYQQKISHRDALEGLLRRLHPYYSPSGLDQQEGDPLDDCRFLKDFCTDQDMATLELGGWAVNVAIKYCHDDFVGWDQLFGMIDLQGKPEWGGESYPSPLGAAIHRHRERGGGINVITKLLHAGCKVNGIAETDASLETSGLLSWTALQLAIQARDEELVQLLIDHGADVHQLPLFTVKRTPLQEAAEAGSLQIVRLLLKYNCDVNAAPSVRSGGTALHFAAVSGNVNIAAELLSRGAYLYAAPSKVNGRWPLEGAAEYGRLTMIEYLWKAKENTRPASGVGTGKAGFEEKHCRSAMTLAEKNGHIACRDLIADLAGLNG
ncbi:hypothetical protein GGR52DRAFT_554482 [Hypoxylon sp. FL1284]|nr:hypothetical protein GGR52DRAFT_554482 [Hypoxylon sp. FL1284]